jgi:hypothetical protein
MGSGKWEGAKVRDLVDALDTSSSSSSTKDGANEMLEKGVFVMKHEVLMMRRFMGES